MREAADGEQALQAARAEPAPGLVLLDIRMPRLDGLGALRALRGDEATRHLPVVMMTASRGMSASYRSALDQLGHRSCCTSRAARRNWPSSSVTG